jgi:hypothetical protein
MRLRTAAALAAVLAFTAAAAAQEEPAKPAPSAPDEAAKRKEAKVRKYLGLLRWKEAFLAELEAGFETQRKVGALPRGFAKKFREVADFDALERIAVEAWSEVLDEPTLDGVIAFLSTEPGTKYAAALTRMPSVMQARVFPWAMETSMKAMQEVMASPPSEEEGEEESGEKSPIDTVLDKARENLHEAKVSANETAAIATLRNLCSCQAQMQASGKIDCDRDGIGEHGTFLEMSGSAEVRAAQVRQALDGKPAPDASDFSQRGTKLNPPILSPKLAGVDEHGVVRKNGYCYRIYLPDSAKTSMFVHETGPANVAGLAGGTGRVGIDMSEVSWCAYAWPEKIGETGNRAFFTNMAGDVMQSSNEKARWEGDKAPPGSAAFQGDGMTAPIAIGTLGRDGDVWKVCN